MAFGGIKPGRLIPVRNGLREETCRAGLEQLIPKRKSGRIKRFPQQFERFLVKISQNNAAALPAEDVSERVDVDSASVQEGILAGLLLDCLKRKLGRQRPDGFGSPACKPAAVLLEHFLKNRSVFGV